MERRGSGFKKICQDYSLQANYREELHPKFYSDNYDFVLTLYNLNYGVGNGATDMIPQSSPKFPKVPQSSPKFPNLGGAVVCFLECASKISGSYNRIFGKRIRCIGQDGKKILEIA
jgi:hypothetical protein